MKEELISVIIPVYNVEEYLHRCIDSILNQTYQDIEIILIDDGSTDNSGKICDEYALKDNRIRVIHKENGGLSDARNIGLNSMKGKYVTFIDSDDYVENFYIKELYELIIKYNSEMSICPYTIITNNRYANIGKDYKETVLNTETCLSRMLLEEGFSVSACAKLYKVELFENIKFPKGKLYEDNGITYKLILKSNKIAYGGTSIYKYYIRDNSITNKQFLIKDLDYIYLTDIAADEIFQKYKLLESECQINKAMARIRILIKMANSTLNREGQKAEKECIYYIRKNYKALICNKYANIKFKFLITFIKIDKKMFKLLATIYKKYK